MSEQRQSTGSSTLLLVHGRDFKPAEDDLLDISLAAIRAGIERDYPDHLSAYDSLSKEMAYFGDLTNQYLASIGERRDEKLDLHDRKNALAALRSISARKRFGIRPYDRLPGKSALQEFIADVAAPALGALGMTRWLIGRVSKDFCEYLRDSEFAAEVRHRVRTRLCDLMDRGDRVLLVSHGTGCVVVYDVLWELSNSPDYSGKYGAAKVDTWLTLGAPLGDTFIRKHLLGATRGATMQYPTNVITWINVSAEDDYTCHDNTLADDFKKMLHKHLVSAVTDYHVCNLAVRYGRSNPHSSVGYYIHPRVSKTIVDWIQASAI